MTFMVWLSALALSLLYGLVFSFPVPDDSSPTSLLTPPISVADTDGLVASEDSPLDAVNTLLLVAPAQITALPFFLPPQPSDPPLATAEDPGSVHYYSPLFSIDTDMSQSATSIAIVTDTVTDTQTQTQTLTESPTTRITTMTAARETVTEIVTVFVPTSTQPPATSASTTPAPDASSGARTKAASWAAPPQMKDLSAFNISAFPAGQQNLALVTGIPASATTGASASATADPLFPAFLDPLLPLPMPTSSSAPFGSNSASASNSNSDSYMTWDNTSVALQLLYPARSANPAAKPVGGAEFYATPLDLAQAQVVEMTYSVFFPADFNWVKCGKLPGLFGGRGAGCSGGDAATDCFSTRLMWRQKGAGELYLYAPKDKQTEALCNDPQSVCDADYGLSVGRDSFKWRAGGWTTVTQIVRLNTPGKQDGGFALYVNGERRIWREDVYYRAAPPNASKSVFASATSSTSSASDGDKDGDGDGDGDDPLGLGTLLPTLLPGLLGPRATVEGPLLLPVPTPTPTTAPPTKDGDIVLPSDAEWAVEVPPAPVPAQNDAAETITTTMSTVTTTVIVYPTLLPASDQAAPRTGPVEFVGIFFSTFFGGHGAAYTTPRDQYVWFKDFALALNQ
ncbi:Polysaccharide lyase family 14 protein [Mycena venus]|uniref:Polysaccharide lyase family 14 protein n=1 Tax=Mycena venus TaxID=2733690 RepID=A0A8H7D049_9AGAR|nr:Polysaccharide lyase family 14 protein [Mycena venus]